MQFSHLISNAKKPTQCGLLHPRYLPPGINAINFTRNCFRVLVLWRWTALRDIHMRLPISPSAISRTQCKIKILCSCSGRLAKASATSSLLISKSYSCDEKM